MYLRRIRDPSTSSSSSTGVVNTKGVVVSGSANSDVNNAGVGDGNRGGGVNGGSVDGGGVKGVDGGVHGNPTHKQTKAALSLDVCGAEETNMRNQVSEGFY